MTITPHTTCPAFHQSVPLSYSEVACFVPVAKSSPKDVVEREKTAPSFHLSIKRKIKIKHSTSSQNEFFILEYPYSVTLFWIFSPLFFLLATRSDDREFLPLHLQVLSRTPHYSTSLFCCISLSNLSGADPSHLLCRPLWRGPDRINISAVLQHLFQDPLSQRFVVCFRSCFVRLTGESVRLKCVGSTVNQCVVLCFDPHPRSLIKGNTKHHTLDCVCPPCSVEKITAVSVYATR